MSAPVKNQNSVFDIKIVFTVNFDEMIPAGRDQKSGNSIIKLVPVDSVKANRFIGIWVKAVIEILKPESGIEYEAHWDHEPHVIELSMSLAGPTDSLLERISALSSLNFSSEGSRYRGPAVLLERTEINGQRITLNFNQDDIITPQVTIYTSPGETHDLSENPHAQLAFAYESAAKLSDIPDEKMRATIRKTVHANLAYLGTNGVTGPKLEAFNIQAQEKQMAEGQTGLLVSFTVMAPKLG